jgi:hypothetical protein
MRAYLSAVALITVLLASSVAACRSTPASNLTGTWRLHVQGDDGGWEDPAFVFKQRGDKLTGTYDGCMGHQEVTGTVTGSTVVFGFHTPRPVRLETITFTSRR